MSFFCSSSSPFFGRAHTCNIQIPSFFSPFVAVVSFMLTFFNSLWHVWVRMRAIPHVCRCLLCMCAFLCVCVSVYEWCVWVCIQTVFKIRFVVSVDRSFIFSFVLSSSAGLLLTFSHSVFSSVLLLMLLLLLRVLFALRCFHFIRSFTLFTHNLSILRVNIFGTITVNAQHRL